jgi:hypothetical protein
MPVLRRPVEPAEIKQTSRFFDPHSAITENIRQRIEEGAVCWAWVANLILLHNFKVFALKIKRGTLALLDQQ